MNNIEEEINALDAQVILGLLFIGGLFALVVIDYNKELILKGEEPLFSAETSRIFSLCLRIFLVILLFIYLYLDYERHKEFENIPHTQKQDNDSNLQLLAVILLTISGIITLYITLTRNNEL